MSYGRYLISSGVLPFTAAPYGLLSVATQLDLTDAHWRRGVVWEPLCPDTDGTFDPCAAVVDVAGTGTPVTEEQAPVPKAETFEWQIRGATPFTAYSRIDCSPVGMWDELPTRNQQALIRSESRFIEETFWTGTAGTSGQPTVFPHLAANSTVTQGEDLLQMPATVVDATPQVLEVGIGMLEAAIRDCYPGVATLHIPLRLGSLLANHRQTTARSGVLTTLAGSKIALGSYPGTAPDGTEPADNVTWIYATGEVFYLREPTPHSFTPVESLDRNVNTLGMIAERTYVIGWDCCLFAIPILNGEL